MERNCRYLYKMPCVTSFFPPEFSAASQVLSLLAAAEPVFTQHFDQGGNGLLLKYELLWCCHRAEPSVSQTGLQHLPARKCWCRRHTGAQI